MWFNRDMANNEGIRTVNAIDIQVGDVINRKFYRKGTHGVVTNVTRMGDFVKIEFDNFDGDLLCSTPDHVFELYYRPETETDSKTVAELNVGDHIVIIDETVTVSRIKHDWLNGRTLVSFRYTNHETSESWLLFKPTDVVRRGY